MRIQASKVVLLSSLLFPLGARAQSQIERVTVFTDRAEVTRVAEVACSPDAQLEFPSLPPAIDLSSLRATAGNATVESLETQVRARAEAFSPQVAVLEEKLRAVALREAEERDAIEAAHTRIKLARALARSGSQQIDREMPLAAPDVKQWSAAYEQALSAELRANEELQKATARLRIVERTQAGLAEQRDKLFASSQATETFARVRIACPPGKRARVELTYVAFGASWAPSYEARADEPSSGRGDGPGQVELALFGTVVQSTGEPWTQAQLILSTALPRTDATPPELAPLYVYAEKREPPKKVLVARDEARTHAENGAAENEEVAGVSQQGLSVQFPISAAADVPGDGTPARLRLATVKVPATFAWRVFPSQQPYVFRAADLTNAAPFALLAGPVDLFRKSGLMGRAQLERVAAGAPFHLAFGLEERFRVKRIVVQEMGRDTGVFSKSKRLSFRYAFELQSLLPDPVSLEVADRVPVSELDDVKVSLDEATTPGFTLEKDDGIVRWTQTLEPAEKKRLELAFHVDVPESYDLTGR